MKKAAAAPAGPDRTRWPYANADGSAMDPADVPPDAEPVFTVRASDPAAMVMATQFAHHYRRACQQKGANAGGITADDQKEVDARFRMVKQMRAWRRANGFE